MTARSKKTTPYLRNHAYSPSALHMGDCDVCGHVEASSIHAPEAEAARPDANDFEALTQNRDSWQRAAEAAEARVAELAGWVQQAIDVLTDEQTKSVFTLAAIHGQKYSGPVFDVEKARVALKKPHGEAP